MQGCSRFQNVTIRPEMVRLLTARLFAPLATILPKTRRARKSEQPPRPRRGGTRLSFPVDSTKRYILSRNGSTGSPHGTLRCLRRFFPKLGARSRNSPLKSIPINSRKSEHPPVGGCCGTRLPALRSRTKTLHFVPKFPHSFPTILPETWLASHFYSEADPRNPRKFVRQPLGAGAWNIGIAARHGAAAPRLFGTGSAPHFLCSVVALFAKSSSGRVPPHRRFLLSLRCVLDCILNLHRASP
jgi:hypothetical protein